MSARPNRRVLAAAVGLLAVGGVPPRSPEAATSCSAPDYRRLDFWVGDWNVFDADDRTAVAARTRVEPILGGCAIRESYEGADGHAGESLTAWDAGRRVWHQTWVTNRGALLAIEGRFDGGALTMEGTQHSADGRSETIRGTWKREGRGVRETAFVSSGGAAWRPLFDIVFLPRAGGTMLDPVAAPAPDDQETIARLNREYIAAFLRSDVEWYRAHLVDDFVCIDSDGTVLDRKAFLEDAAKGPNVADYRLEDVRVRVRGDAALVHATGLFTRRDGTKGRSRYTDVWQKSGGGWKAVSAQITRIPG